MCSSLIFIWSTSYTAIYSGFAILLLFMIWLYLGWLILLIGASISYYYQHPQSLRWKSEQYALSAVMRENLSLQLMLHIGRAHYLPGQFSAMPEHLLNAFNVPQIMIKRMLNNLLSSGLIVLSEGPNARYLPALALEKISLADILRVAREAEDSGLTALLKTDSVVDDIRHKITTAIEQSVSDKTLMDLVLSAK